MSVIRWIDKPTRQTILLLSLLPRLTANRLQYLNTRLSQGVAGLEHLDQDLHTSTQAQHEVFWQVALAVGEEVEHDLHPIFVPFGK